MKTDDWIDLMLEGLEGYGDYGEYFDRSKIPEAKQLIARKLAQARADEIMWLYKGVESMMPKDVEKRLAKLKSLSSRGDASSGGGENE